MTVPSYGNRPCLPSYRLEDDPCYRPDRIYGPGYPFCSPAHEAYEAARMAREKVDAFILKAIAEAEKVALAVGYNPPRDEAPEL